MVQSLLTELDLAPDLVTLEITESLMLEHSAWNLAVLEELRALGVRLALDDFGTGYSALTHLRRLPIDTIKMDRSFLDGIDARDGEATVRAIVELARVHGMEVVAEGIETARDPRPRARRRLPPWPGLPLRSPRTPRCRAAVAARRDPAASVGSPPRDAPLTRVRRGVRPDHNVGTTTGAALGTPFRSPYGRGRSGAAVAGVGCAGHACRGTRPGTEGAPGVQDEWGTDVEDADEHSEPRARWWPWW